MDDIDNIAIALNLQYTIGVTDRDLVHVTINSYYLCLLISALDMDRGLVLVVLDHEDFVSIVYIYLFIVTIVYI